MKRLSFLMLMLIVVLSASAQEVIKAIDRDVTFTGQLYVLCKSKEITQKTAYSYGEDAKWYIKNDRIGDNNYISFWIEDSEGKKYEYNSWKEHGVTILLHIDKNRIAYEISDDTFRYLLAAQIEDGRHGIQLYTFLK